MGFLYSQFFVRPAYPTESFSGKTVIVTGSNTGLGLEAARHIAKLDAERVILAVRNLKAGEEAKRSIEASARRPGCCEVWELDLASYASVKAFANRALQQLNRLDCLIENAGIVASSFQKAEDNESSITVNVISTFLLGIMLLPKLQETASRYGTKTRLTIVTSEVHGWCKFPERSSDNILADLGDPDKANMAERYPVTKLLEVLTVRQLAPMLTSGKNKDVIINMLNPGLCHSSLARNVSGLMHVRMVLLKTLVARTTEMGSRTLVASAVAGPESHGTYMSDGIVHDEEVVGWVQTEEGDRVGAKVWKELAAKLEAISPGVTKNLA